MNTERTSGDHRRRVSGRRAHGRVGLRIIDVMPRVGRDTLTIGQLARASSVPTSTIRYYERVGLLKPDARTGSNYRTYSRQTARRLSFIRSAQASGFSLHDIREMLALIHSDGPPCADVASVIQRRLKGVRQQLRELRRIDRALTAAVKSCCNTDPDWCCEIVRLRGGASAENPCRCA